MRPMNFGRILDGLDADDIADVVRLVVENREVIARLGQLPELFDQFSDSLAGAGTEAKEAAVALLGGEGSTGARGVLEDASRELAGVVESFTKGIGLIQDTAVAAHKVPLMDGPADRLEGAAREMGESTALLSQLAASMDSIAELLGKVGAALDRAGDHLGDTSSQARGFLAAP